MAPAGRRGVWPTVPGRTAWRAARLSLLSALLSCGCSAGAPVSTVSPMMAWPAASAVAPAGRAALAFTGVTVIDVQDGSLHPEQTVVVTGTRITALGPMRTVRVPAGAKRVDARGKYLIPGLWDMHIHVMGFPEVFYPLLIANGVTGIRDMGTPIPLDTVHRWQREVTAGTRVGPRQVNAGASLDNTYGPQGIGCEQYRTRSCPFHRYRFMTPVGTPERARFVVDSIQAAGADFIKVHELESREVYFAVAAEARRRGIPFAGHVNAPFLESADSGQRSFEHDLGSRWCSNAGATDARCRQLAEGLRRHNAWIVSTGFGEAPTDLSTCEARAHLRYWPDSVTRHVWLEDSSYSPKQWSVPPPAEGGFYRRAHAVQLPLMAGTDATSTVYNAVPGFSLQNEVIRSAEGGYPTLEALQMATLNPAKYFNATDSLGTVAPGKLADLVLLDADPLADIHNLRKIRAVVANGRYFDRAALDALLQAVEQRGAAHWAC